MRSRLFTFIFIAFFAGSCYPDSDCSHVIITQNGTICSTWGIKINGQVYPSENIPANFQKEGLVACANFELY